MKVPFLLLVLLLSGCVKTPDKVRLQLPAGYALYYDGHYVVSGRRVELGQRVTINYRVDGGPVVPTEGVAPAAVRLFIWREGDPMSCAGEYRGYRYWHPTPGPLTPGLHSITVTVGPGWTDCYAQYTPESFQAAVDHGRIGFTFGGEFYGHGVKGNATFTLLSLEIQ